MKDYIARRDFIVMRLIENYNTGCFGGIRRYEMCLNSTQVEHPDADIVLLTNYLYDTRLRIWVPGLAHHGDTTYKVTAVVRAYSRREKNGYSHSFTTIKHQTHEMWLLHGDHTTQRDMTLHIEDQ